MAHNLRNPLRAMNGFAKILADDYKEKLDQSGLDCLEEIQKNAVRMAALIDAILAIARVTRTELHVERTDLTAIAREVVGRLASNAPARKIELVLTEGMEAEIDPRWRAFSSRTY